MTAYMAFRGPDGLHCWANGNIGLGHAHFRSYDDVELVPQPFYKNGFWITADARIDGRKDLCDKLELKGHKVHARTPDAQLILEAYLCWGTDCLEHLMGDFSFIIWDERQQRLFCACDHFSITPFYYASLGNTVLLSNTLDALRLHPELSDELNEQVIGDYLTSTFNRSGTDTIYTAIKRLAPAHALLIERDGIKSWQYWQPPETQYLRYKQPETYVEQFEDLFHQAITDRARSSKATIELSGGMDSSSVAAMLSQEMHKSNADLLALTYGFERVLHNQEKHYSSLVANHHGFRQQVIDFDAFDPNTAPDPLTYLPPEPHYLQVYTRLQSVLKLATQQGPLFFNGHGGDNLFGTDPYQWWNPKHSGSLKATAQDLYNHWRVFGRKRPNLGLDNTIFKKWQSRKSDFLIPFPQWLEADFVKRTNLLERKDYFDEIDGKVPDRHCMASWGYMQSAMITPFDPSFTGVSLKSAYPFYDLRLFNYSLRVPPIPWAQQKAILRLAMRKHLPSEITERPKTLLSHNTNMFHQLFRSTGVPEWFRQLVGTSELNNYIDTKSLGDCLDPKNSEEPLYRLIYFTGIFAHWLSADRSKKTYLARAQQYSKDVRILLANP
jgi:asparagine synthase (glutamine-hydrolysing)